MSANELEVRHRALASACIALHVERATREERVVKKIRHPREGGDPAPFAFNEARHWIPAFAGMTADMLPIVFDRRACDEATRRFATANEAEADA